MNHQDIASAMARNIREALDTRTLADQKWDAAVRLQLGCPDGRPLPQDPVFAGLYRQLGAARPNINMDLSALPDYKRALILLAIHAILTD